MLFELIRFTVRHPHRGFKILHVLKVFRQHREALRCTPVTQGSIDEIQYTQVAILMNIQAAFVRATVEEWIMLRPLRHLRICRRPGIEEFLEICRDKGIRVGAFSDYPTHEKVEALGLRHWFDLHLCSTDPEINMFKPSPEGILLACKTWRLTPEELLYVGDQGNIDGAAATAAGARFVLVGHSQESQHFAVRDFFELADCL
jgi:HAD superfamily hydrolase (TIGR01549 family)